MRNFPTRSYPYRRSSPAEGPVVTGSVAAGKIFRLVLGRDQPPGQEMTAEELAMLGDPFALLVLRRGKLPTTLRALLADLAEHDGSPDGIPVQRSFLVAEGGQVQWSQDTAGLDRGARLVLARGRGNQFELFISTTTPFDSDRIFLQVLAWDAAAGAFQYYERRGGSWFWAGSSWDALEDDTRGQGPFDSHVNGAMVMKELKAPWIHWHSMAQTIPPESFNPADPLLSEPLFRERTGAEMLEAIVRFGVERWTRARLDKILSGGTLERADRLMRQVLTTTTVNIATSSSEFDGPGDEPIIVPLPLVFNSVALLDVLGLDVDVTLRVERSRYRQACKAIGLRVRDSNATPPFERKGDVFFAWATPEPAFEDVAVLQHLLARGLLSRHFAASVLMVDFPNAVGSKARDSLMAHVPIHVDLAGESSLEAQMRAAILESASKHPDSPSVEAAANLALADLGWEVEFAGRLNSLCSAVQAHLDTDDGLKQLLLLADSRRRAFRRRPLAEFDMTLPWADVADGAPLLRLKTDGTVVPDQ